MAETNVPIFQTNSEFAPTTMSSKASEADMDHCAQLIRRAGRFLETGDVEAAEASLRQGLDRVPEHPECVAYLAVCLAAGKRKYVTAEKLVTNIINKNPYDSTAWYALGRVNLLGGRRDQAFKNFEKAKRVSRGDRNIEVIVDEMDPRREPVISFLPRNNVVNIWFGRLRANFNL
jgi:tetratricopeptide (TPR) repeat protein